MHTELGGLFMVGLPATELDASTLELIERQGIHNFILFKRNVADPAQVRRLCRDLAAACRRAGLPAPLVSIDQEGGSVARLKAPHFTEFADARNLADCGDAEGALAGYARTCARELLDIGVNMNLAPVLDVCPGGQGLVMERRSLGEDPGRVARLGSLVIGEMQALGVAACAKHFPGLGAAALDPHEVRPVVDRGAEEMEACDLRPFRAAIAAGVAAVMTSHTLYPRLDPEQPATLSAPILTGLLRGKLGYSGLVVTDDLEMGAIENEGTVADAALRAFAAGADLLLICQEHDKVRAAHANLLAEVEEGRFEHRVRESLRRIAAVRQRFARG